MATIQVPALSVEGATTKFWLSDRGAYNMVHRDIWGIRAKQFSNPWTPGNPQGIINLRLAENNMLHQRVQDFIHRQLRVEGPQHLTYSTGPRGSMRLRRAAARFLEDDFNSVVPITEDDIFITPGLTSAVDAVVWAICDEGDGAVVVEADYHDLDGYSSIDDIFDPYFTNRALEAALARSKKQGIRARAVLIANPHNPLGRCYPLETLTTIASFCQKNQLHFIADEIYAKSVFHNPNIADAPAFHSTLSIDLSKYIDRDLHHVLYGASKDFCANGLRLGLLYTKNKGILGAISSISPFSWSPHILQDVWAAMLEDSKWRDDFIQDNKRLMSEAYTLATTFLRDHKIDFYEMNAGVYIWLDLRPYFVPHTERAKNDYRRLKVAETVNDYPSTSSSSSPGSSTTNTNINTIANEQREIEIIELCARNGVMIAPGSSYRAEEFGWFRLTFTTPEVPLREGLERLWLALTQLGEVA